MRCLLLTSDFIGLAVQITCLDVACLKPIMMLVMEVSITAATQASLLSSLVLE